MEFDECISNGETRNGKNLVSPGENLVSPLEIQNPLKQALLHPEYRIPVSMLQMLKEELVDLAIRNGVEFPIEPEYWKNPMQYDPMVHPNEPGAPHIALRGRNCFSSPIVQRSGNGKLEEIPPGKSFRTHPLIYLDG